MRFPILAVVPTLLPLPALADLTQASAPAPGGFLQTGAFSAICNCGVRPGNDIRALSVNPDFAEDSFLPAEQVSLASSFTLPESSAAAAATAGFGFVRGTASRRSPDTNSFTTGILNGGWNERFTISHPSRTGQAGFFRFRVRAQATLVARDLTGSAACQLCVYVNGTTVALNPLFDLGNADTTFGDQWVQWGVATFQGNDVATREVDGVVTFAVPFTFGQPFRLGVYAAAFATQRSSGGFGNTWSSSSIDFSRGAAWNGIVDIQASDGPVTGSTIVSGSGVDWNGPVGGCPADVNHDGFLDFFDYDDFVAAFESGGPSGDFNGDGFLDFFDYDGFVAAFEAGC